MGYFMGATKGEQCVSKRVGSYGSQNALSAILFAGYAAGKFPQSKRVRAWIGPFDSMFYGSNYRERLNAEAPGLPTNFRMTRSLRDLQELLAYGHDNCHWVQFETTGGFDRPTTRVMDNGLKLSNKPATCPILKGLVLFDSRLTADEMPNITPEEARQIAPAVEAILPLLQSNIWHDDVAEVLAVLKFAADNEVEVRCG